MAAMRFFLVAAIFSTNAFAQNITLGNGEPDPNYPGLHGWYDPASGLNGLSGMPADGTPITHWNDKGSQGNHLGRNGGAGRQPIFRAVSANGLPALDFEGNDYIWGDQSQFGTIQGAKTIFVACQITSPDGGYVFDGCSSSGRNALLTGQNSAPGKWNAFTGTGSFAGGTVHTDTMQVHSVVFGTSQQELFLNGSSVAQGAFSLSQLSGFVLGARYSTGDCLDGTIAEVLVYDEELGAGDRKAIEAYLISKHPITQPPPGPEFIDVFWSNDGYYPQYRIPSIIKTQAGSLIALIEGRESISDHAKNDIVMKRSTDDGDTWGPPITLHDAGSNCLNNPCIVQLDTIYPGRLLLMFQQYPYGCHEGCVGQGYTGNICRGYLMWSDDDGLSWSAPLNITQQVKRPTGDTSICSGPGRGIQLRYGPWAGRIIFPFNHNGTTGWKNYAVYSDDGGISWQWGDDAPDANLPSGVRGNEVQMVERVDGSILLNARSTGGSHRLKAVSNDGGLTWGQMEIEDELIEPHCMATILRQTDQADGFRENRILYAGPNRTSGRSNGKIWVSFDEGESWPVNRTIYSGGYAYSQLVEISDTEIGVLFERDGYDHITLAKFPHSWIARGADPLMKSDPYGHPTPGSGGVNPALQTLGTSEAGKILTLGVLDAPALSQAFIVASTARAQTFLNGCDLFVKSPFDSVFPLNLDAAGTAQLDFSTPASLSGVSVCVQAGVVDPGAPSGSGWSATGAVQIWFL